MNLLDHASDHILSGDAISASFSLSGGGPLAILMTVIELFGIAFALPIIESRDANFARIGFCRDFLVSESGVPLIELRTWLHLKYY